MATTTIYVSKDAEGWGDQPNNNFGGITVISSGVEGGSIYHIAFFEFDLSSISGATINSATFNVYQNTEMGNGNAATLKRMTSQFTENTITYNTHPATTDTNLVNNTFSNNQWNSVTVTGMVSDAVAGGFLGIKIMPTGGYYFYRTKEYAGSYSAYLYIDYTPGCSTYNDIYVNSSTGNDSACGATSGTPVQTFARAYALLNSGGTIHCLNSGADFSAETVTMNKSFSIDLNGSSGNFYMPKAS